MHARVLGIDLGKRWFHVVERDEEGQVVLRQRLNRNQMHHFMAQHTTCLVGMEMCCGSQHLGRKFAAMGSMLHTSLG